MLEITLFDAKTHLSKLISDVENNHIEFIITKRGKQVAKVVPIDTQEKHDIATVLKEMDTLRREIGKTGISIEEILEYKSIGRK